MLVALKFAVVTQQNVKKLKDNGYICKVCLHFIKATVGFMEEH